jgi:hypothetical protein
MKVWHLVSDDDGASHVNEIDVPLETVTYAPPAPPFHLSAPLAASRALLSVMPAGWFGDWHPSPVRQLYLALSGELEVIVSDGARLLVRPGDVVLVEDTEGQGHTTRVLGDEPARGVFIHLLSEG